MDHGEGIEVVVEGEEFESCSEGESDSDEEGEGHVKDSVALGVQKDTFQESGAEEEEVWNESDDERVEEEELTRAEGLLALAVASQDALEKELGKLPTGY